jgi:hypothetical protein
MRMSTFSTKVLEQIREKDPDRYEALRKVLVGEPDADGEYRVDLHSPEWREFTRQYPIPVGDETIEDRGPALWTKLHRASFAQTPLEFSETLDWIVARLPCGDCKEHARAYRDQHPLPDTSAELFAWSVDFHNAVNRRLGKSEWSYDVARQLWTAPAQYLVHVGFRTAEHVATALKLAEDMGLDYRFVSVHDDIHTEAAATIKYASFALIWNGTQHNTSLAASICAARGIPALFYEWGMLPQGSTFFIDPGGFCGASVMCGDLKWVTDQDMRQLERYRAKLQRKYPLCPEPGRVLLVLQIENDTQILHHTSINSMAEFIQRAETVYDPATLVVRPHPKSGNQRPPTRGTIETGGDFLSAAAKSQKVVALTSTCLYEAAVLGVPVRATGHHPLAVNAHQADRVAAAALALRVNRDGDSIWHIARRFGLKPNRTIVPPAGFRGGAGANASRVNEAVKRSRVAEGRTNEQDLTVLASLVVEHGAVSALEIGSFHGRSAMVLLYAGIKLLLCVDDFSGLQLDGGRIPGIERARVSFYHNVPPAARETGAAVQMFELNSVTDAAELRRRIRKSVGDEGWVDLAFVDGHHGYESVLADIETATTVLKPDGLLVGHDWNLAGVRRAVVECFGETRVKHEGKVWFVRV